MDLCNISNSLVSVSFAPVLYFAHMILNVHQTISIHWPSRAYRAGNLVDVRLLDALGTKRHTTTLILQGVLNSRKSTGP
jgi:hypothetical protein